MTGNGDTLCLHCGRPCRARCRRGLCRRCYDAAGVRCRYGRLGLLAHLGAGLDRLDGGDFDGPAPPPRCPTAAEPGSPRKIAILVERAAERRGLFHPDDRAITGCLAGDGSRRRLAQLQRLAAAMGVAP
jgi:hypothetical protein